MKRITQTTKSIKEHEIKRNWHLIDMSGKVLGRSIPQIVQYLVGKHKVNYVPYLDSGDYVVVINTRHLVLTGKKAQAKTYGQYSGYPGGLLVRSFERMLKENPETLVRHAVSGMLPKNKTRDTRLARLYIYQDDNHPYKEKFTK